MTLRTGLAVGLLYVLAVVSYISHYVSSSQIFLWIGVIVSFVAVFIGTSKNVGEGYRLVSVILFLFSLRTLPMLRLSFSSFTFSGDAADALQLAHQINEEGKFGFGIGTGRAAAYSFFPALYILTVVLANVSGLSIETIAYLFPLLTGGLTLAVLYTIIRQGLSYKVAALAIIIYSQCRTFIFFDGNYLPETFGLVFYAIYLMIFFFIFVDRRMSPKFALIGIIACVMTAVSHHWSAWNIIVTLTFFSFFKMVYDYFLSGLQKQDLRLRLRGTFLLTTLCIIVAWLFFVGYEVMYADLKLFTVFLKSLFDPTIRRVVPSLHLNTPLEGILIVAGQSVLVIVGISKFVASIFERGKDSSKIFFHFFFVFGSAYAFLSYFGAPVSFYYYSQILTRSWSFAFFGLSPIIAWGLIEIPFVKLTRWKKLIRYTPLLLILPLISTILLAPVSVRNPSSYPEVESYRNTGLWIRCHLADGTVVVDSYARETVATHGRITETSLPIIRPNVPDEEIDRMLIIYKSENLSFVAPSGSIVVLNNQLDRLRLWFISTGKPLEMANATVYLMDTDLRCQRMYDCGSLTILKGLL